jgi:bacillithiol biosynthesis deacetylase BshB1
MRAQERLRAARGKGDALKVVAFGAHPDDVELAAAGTLAHAAAAGHAVVIADLTRGERATAGTPEERAREAADAARVLGATRTSLDLPDLGLDRRAAPQLAAVVGLLRRERPDLVLAPTGRDPHPDHVEAHHLVRRAAFTAGLAAYEPGAGAPHRPRLVLYYPSSREPYARPPLVVDVSATIDRKMAALACYASQFLRAPAGPATLLNAPGFLERVRARAAACGIELGLAHAEPFFPDRPLVASDPLKLLALAMEET